MLKKLCITIVASAVLFICPSTWAEQKSQPIHGTEYINFQAGDIILFVSPNPVQRFINGIATGGDITHSGLVIMGKDGTLQIMHALGNNDGISYKFNPGEDFGVVIEPLTEALTKERDKYSQQLFLRPRKTPLSEDMSKALTDFAYRQQGKPYSSGKVSGPLIVRPFKNRPLATEPSAYMCSELACTALVAIGALPAIVNPPAITPFDLYKPDRLNIPLWQSHKKIEAAPLVYNLDRPFGYDPYMVPTRDRYGNTIKDIFGNEKKTQGYFNPIEYHWKMPKPLVLPPTEN